MRTSRIAEGAILTRGSGGWRVEFRASFGSAVARFTGQWLAARSELGFELQLPFDCDGTLLKDKTMVVTGKEMSLSGISLSHDRPVPYHRVLLELDHPEFDRLTIQAEIIWTRKTPRGDYESGGRPRWSITDEALQEND